MCWEGRIKDKRIATRNMTAYKILERLKHDRKNKSYRSPFQLCPYNMGQEYVVEDGLNVRKATEDTEFAAIYKGFHCYSPNVYAMFKSSYKGLSVYDSRHSEFPLYHYTNSHHRLHKTVAVKCTIPKGATYYINDRGEIVTDHLILDCELGIPTNTSPLRFRELYKNNLFK